MKPSARAATQYSQSTGKLTARMAIHAYGTNPQSWFSWLSSRLPVTGDILEVGAGTGELWRQVDHSGARLTLVDSSAAMCARLRDIPDAVVEQCDAAALPFADASFDGVIANHMLYHVDDPDAVLREFARVLRPGGRLAVALNGPEHMAELIALGPAIGRPDLALMTRSNGVDSESGAALIARHFVAVGVEAHPGELEIPVAEPVLAYLETLGDAPLSPAEDAAARQLIAAAGAPFRVRKSTSLLTAKRAADNPA
jgi:SAM-dependent methyltransferase